jgi:lipopolysaccharide/colanic/teichoic acid biosynthesis glycosyltransferase
LGDMSIIGPRPQAPEHFEVFPSHVKRELIKVRPGLSGIGSIVFRNEENLMAEIGGNHDAVYRDVIAVYKGELELWFIRNQSAVLYLLLIVLTVWVVIVPGSKAYRTLFRDLPPPSSELELLI